MKKFVLSAVVAGSLMGMGSINADAANTSAKDDYVIINKTYNKLAFYQDKKLVSVHSVATGKTRDLTPEGKFKIVQKIVNRPYWAGGIPGGDPRNPLGNRWMGISIPNMGNAALWGTQYGIHGNNNPSSIGKYASSGCIRMLDNEIENDLYPKVLMNTPVYITSSYKSFAALTNDLGYINPVVKAVYNGQIDSNSIEVKTTAGKYMVIRATSTQVKYLVEKGTYNFEYKTNSYGQNVFVKASK